MMRVGQWSRAPSSWPTCSRGAATWGDSASPRVMSRVSSGLQVWGRSLGAEPTRAAPGSLLGPTPGGTQVNTSTAVTAPGASEPTLCSPGHHWSSPHGGHRFPVWGSDALRCGSHREARGQAGSPRMPAMLLSCSHLQRRAWMKEFMGKDKATQTARPARGRPSEMPPGRRISLRTLAVSRQQVRTDCTRSSQRGRLGHCGETRAGGAGALSAQRPGPPVGTVHPWAGVTRKSPHPEAGQRMADH